MARTTVYRTIGSVRRTSIPRAPRMTVGTSAFGRMLAKLSIAGETLQQSRPTRRR